MESNHWWRDSGKSNQRQEFEKRVFPHSSVFRGSVLSLTVSYPVTHPRHELFSNLGSSELLRGLIRTHTSLDSHLSFWHPTPGERWVTVALKQDRSHRTLMLLIQDDTWRTTDVNDSRIKPEPQMQEQEHSLSFCNSAKMVFESLSTWQGGGNVITVHSGFNLTFFCVPPVLAC